MLMSRIEVSCRPESIKIIDYNLLSETEQLQYRKKFFDYYRAVGFPYYPTNSEFRDAELFKLNKCNVNILIKDKIISQRMFGLALAWSYFPHSYSVKCNGCWTPIENFFDDKRLMRILSKCMIREKNITDSSLRKVLKMYTGSQGVSNFRPTAASAIYNTYMKKGQTTWDMCAGYGGRLLGAIISNVNYVGTDPDENTFYGLYNLAKDYGSNIKINLIRGGCEVWHPPRKTIDFAFTSPPYFNTERYSNSENQSCVKYPEYDLWVKEFLGNMAKNVYISLRGEYCAINICNIKKAMNLEEHTIEVFKNNGFVLVDELKLALSRVKTKNNSASYKYEPIFIFKKLNQIH